jgi:protein-tyrosine kinase
MGRIEEALRRAGVDTPGQVAEPAKARSQMFVSPWSASSSPEIRPFRNSTSPDQPRLGQFRGFASEWLARLVVPGNTNHVLVEQFRHLAGSLLHAQKNGKLQSVMVTSAVPGDGKTFTSLNLALTLAHSYGRRVLLIDADLRRPSIGQVCGLGNAHGLSEVLRSETEQKLPLFELREGLTFLPAGKPDPDPLGGLTSPRMKTILDEAAEQFEWIVVDSPPAAPLADAGLIGAMVDALLLVVRAGETQCRSVEKAIETLGRERIFGVVLNGAEVVSHEYQSYYGARTENVE